MDAVYDCSKLLNGQMMTKVGWLPNETECLICGVKYDHNCHNWSVERDQGVSISLCGVICRQIPENSQTL